MKRLLTLCIMLTAFALIAGPVFAEVQNVKVSGDVKTSAVYRESYNLYPDARSGSTPHDNFLVTNARVKVDADLTDNVSATIRALSEWEWDTESNVGGTGAQDLIFDLANVTLKELFYQPLTVVVGRQELNYQNGFIIGDPDTNAVSGDADVGNGRDDLSLRKSFDAIKAILDYSPLTVDIFFAKMDETQTTKDDEDLYGINVAYDLAQYKAKVEGFWYFNRDDDETAPDVDTDTISPGHEIHTFGLSGAISPIENLNLTGIVAWQKGDFDKISSTKRDQDAYAFEVAGTYGLPDMGVIKNPLVKLGWTFFSGEEKDNTGDQEAWIPLYEDRSYGAVANYILSGINGGQNSNASILSVGASASPLEDLTLSLDFYKFWLDEKLVTNDNDALTNNDPTNYVNLTDTNYYMKAKKDLGYEIDLGLKYDYTEDVKMGLSVGWFKPGDAFEGVSSDNRNDETAVQVLGTLGVSF